MSNYYQKSYSARRWSLCLVTGLISVCSSNVISTFITISHVLISASLDHTCSHMLTADCLSLPQSPSKVPGCCWWWAPAQTVGKTSRQAGCPDSNNNEEGVHALQSVCALENVSVAIRHLLCTSCDTSITIFYHFHSSWNCMPGPLAETFIIQT